MTRTHRTSNPDPPGLTPDGEPYESRRRRALGIAALVVVGLLILGCLYLVFGMFIDMGIEYIG